MTRPESFPVFYDLPCRSIDRQAFQRIAQALGDTFRAWVAWHDGQPAAAIVVLQGTNAHYTKGALNLELAGSTRANYLLQKFAIEDACRVGCRYYHMGESGLSAILGLFERRFGAIAFPYAEYR